MREKNNEKQKDDREKKDQEQGKQEEPIKSGRGKQDQKAATAPGLARSDRRGMRKSANGSRRSVNETVR